MNSEIQASLSWRGESSCTGTFKTKRLTLNLDEDLHRRIKVACGICGSTMVEEITKLLKKEFPVSGSARRRRGT
jgi:ParG